MDGRLDGLKQWKCKNNHLLGIVDRVAVSGNVGKYHVARLILFRHAIDLDPTSSLVLDDVDVIGNIEGTVMDIRCSVPGCGEVRTWYLGEAALERLIEKRRERIGDQ
jgi:hypothetical protein